MSGKCDVCADEPRTQAWNEKDNGVLCYQEY